MEQIELPYQVRLASFEGPLDLLLHLIKQNEINIYDIPIALITQQYLDYLNTMKSFNLTVAGEFLVMAATLVQIKSRMLLPKEDQAGDEEDGPDPREELVRRLLEYKQFKEAAYRLDHRERLWRDVYYRDAQLPKTLSRSETRLEDVTLFDLVDALQGVLARTPLEHTMEIIPENLTIKDRMNSILEVLHNTESVTFDALFEGACHRVVIIVTFLALLELIRLNMVRVFQSVTFGPVLVSRTFTPATDLDRLDTLEEPNFT
ncbi:MAG: segregation and condensation protein A [bacterium]